MSDADALAALHLFTGCCGQFQLRRIERVGFSGSSIWKVAAAEPILQPGFPHPLCLKRWPADHSPPARLQWIHRVQNEARNAGLKFVPQAMVSQTGATYCEVAGSTWELITWQPGASETKGPSTTRRVAAAFHALARFHEATKSMNATGPAPAFTDRRRRWEELQAGRLEAIRSAFSQRRIPAIDDLAQAWVNQHEQLDSQLANCLSGAEPFPLPLQPAIRDLWRDHVLFQGDEVTGFVDFGAMRIDTPLTDLARLIGSLAGDDAQLRQTALAAYTSIRTLSRREIGLIDLLDHAGVLIAGWNWLDWLYVQQREFPSLAAVRERLSELLSRSRVQSFHD